ncbi:hypothetical protein J132_01381 [Termitomyces sp. J132]|nr:hypothetical protein H2248_011665 [Termitomyces sp. 'cryptogamus']KNZ73572.1 hypothetical protein J132_01381 [Termitomyces sp. J132]
MALAGTARVFSEGHQRVLLANHLSLKYGLAVVRDILANKESPLHSPLGMTTDELYKLSLQHTPSPEFYNPHTRANKPYPPMPVPRIKGKKREQPPAPPNPEHPVRSKAFLKKIILQYLVGTQEIVKTRADRLVDSSKVFKTNKKGKRIPVEDTGAGPVTQPVWVWKSVNVVDPASIKRQPKPPPQLIEPFGAEVGVGEDFSHLNERRQKSRSAAVRRELHMLKVSTAGAELRRLRSGGVMKSRQERNWEEKRLAAREEKRLAPRKDSAAEERKFVPRKDSAVEERGFAPRKDAEAMEERPRKDPAAREERPRKDPAAREERSLPRKGIMNMMKKIESDVYDKSVDRAR